MISRFVIAAVLASLSTLAILAQENSVVIGPPRNGDTVVACGPDGRAFLMHVPQTPVRGAVPESLLGVSRDGTLVTFQVPENRQMTLIAASDGSNLGVLMEDPHLPGHYEIDRFDNQGNLLAQRPLNVDFRPERMAVLPSGKMVLVGVYTPADHDSWKNVAAVVDADGQMLKRTAFPLPPEGGGWVFDSRRMLGGDDGAYIMLHSYEPPATGLAKILEDGNVEIKILPNAPYNDERHHNEWLFGPDVAVEMYHYVDARERCTFHFDEYDLNTGERTASRYALLTGGGFACYSGNEASMLARISYGYPAEGISSDTMRLVFGKLQDQPVSNPVENPRACDCVLRGGDRCPEGAQGAATKP